MIATPRFRVRRIAALCGVALLLTGVPVPAQETQQKPSSLENMLKDLLREGVEGQLSQAKGRVRGVRVREQEGATVILDVDLGEVAAPDTARLACEVFDYRFAPIPGMLVEHAPLAEGDSTVEARVTYTAAGTALSTSLRVSLVDAASGAARSHRRIPLAREWVGDGSGAGITEGVAPPTTDVAEAAPSREPVTVEVALEPVGDTPARGAALPPPARLPGARPAPAPAMVKPRPAAAPTPAPAVGRARPAPAPTPVPAIAVARPMMVAKVGVDLFKLAGQAKWSSPAGALPWPGESGDERGYVKPLGRAALADGKSYDKVLQTHPSFTPNGSIAGAFSIEVPGGATRFVARAGFLPGASRSDGVSVEVVAGSRKLGGRKVHPQDGTVEVAVDLPADLKGQKTVLRLVVRTGPTSTQDWFVWVAPEIR